VKDLLSNVGSGGGAAAPAATGGAAAAGGAAEEAKEEEKPEGQFAIPALPAASCDMFARRRGVYICDERPIASHTPRLQRRRSQTTTWDSVSSTKVPACFFPASTHLFPLFFKTFAWNGNGCNRLSLLLKRREVMISWDAGNAGVPSSIGNVMKTHS
jgi:hypothetical protein